MKIISAEKVMNCNSRHAQEVWIKHCFCPITFHHRQETRQEGAGTNVTSWCLITVILRLSSHQKNQIYCTSLLPYFLFNVTRCTEKRVLCSIADETPHGSTLSALFTFKKKNNYIFGKSPSKGKMWERSVTQKQNKYLHRLHSVLFSITVTSFFCWQVKTSLMLSSYFLWSDVFSYQLCKWGKSFGPCADICYFRSLTSLKWCRNIYGTDSKNTKTDDAPHIWSKLSYDRDLTSWHLFY